VARTARIDAVTFVGRSGKRYDFRVYIWGTQFKSLPAVFVVASRHIEPGESPRYEPLFVGATQDLSKTLEGHPRTDCFQMYYANVVGVLKEGDPATRERITQDLLESLAPPCNAAEAASL
jgi:hypothetical protein